MRPFPRISRAHDVDLDSFVSIVEGMDVNAAAGRTPIQPAKFRDGVVPRPWETRTSGEAHILCLERNAQGQGNPQ